MLRCPPALRFASERPPRPCPQPAPSTLPAYLAQPLRWAPRGAPLLSKGTRPEAWGWPQLFAHQPQFLPQQVAVPSRRDPLKAGGWQLDSTSPGSLAPRFLGTPEGFRGPRQQRPAPRSHGETLSRGCDTCGWKRTLADGQPARTRTDRATSFLVRSQRRHGTGHRGRTGPLRTSAYICQTAMKAPVAGGSSALASVNSKMVFQDRAEQDRIFFKVFCWFFFFFPPSYPRDSRQPKLITPNLTLISTNQHTSSS